MHLWEAIPGGWPRGTPAFAPRYLQIPPFQDEYSSSKSYHCLSPGEHNLKGLPNCSVISCIAFDKSLTAIYAVSKNSYSTCFLTQQGSALYLVSHRMTISTNVHLLPPVFTIRGNTGLKVKNVLSRFLPATKWKKLSQILCFYVSVGLN